MAWWRLKPWGRNNSDKHGTIVTLFTKPLIEMENSFLKGSPENEEHICHYDTNDDRLVFRKWTNWERRDNQVRRKTRSSGREMSQSNEIWPSFEMWRDSLIFELVCLLIVLGDADVAFLAGAKYRKTEKSEMMGVTTVFSAAGVDKQKFLDHTSNLSGRAPWMCLWWPLGGCREGRPRQPLKTPDEAGRTWEEPVLGAPGREGLSGLILWENYISVG